MTRAVSSLTFSTGRFLPCKRCRVEDGDASADNWKDSKGNALAADRFWSSGVESEIAGDDEGPCKGIELNIWERAKVIIP